MDPLLKEFVIFFAFWPLVIAATIFLGMRMGRMVSSTMKPLRTQRINGLASPRTGRK